MKRNARTAFNQLKKIGAPLYDRQEYGAEFILGGELRTSDDVYFADYWNEEIREYRDDDTGKIINAYGIRQDVHDILEANGLHAEWIDGGTCGVYQN